MRQRVRYVWVKRAGARRSCDTVPCMGLLDRLRNAARELTGADKPSSVLSFHWSDWPDPDRPDKRVYECSLPHGAYFLVQEVSAPDPATGHWGWMLLTADSEPVEMRNGFYDAEKAKEHAENHFRTEYAAEAQQTEDVRHRSNTSDTGSAD
jgi:hypothetical protein